MTKFAIGVGLCGSVCGDLITNRFTDPWDTESVQLSISIGSVGELMTQEW